MATTRPSSSSYMEDVLERIERRKGWNFPKQFEATFERAGTPKTWSAAAVRSISAAKQPFKTVARPLLGELIDTLEEMFRDRATLMANTEETWGPEETWGLSSAIVASSRASRLSNADAQPAGEEEPALVHNRAPIVAELPESLKVAL